ncbi:B-cell linker protein isoform X2 [Frankliniella occidentalis]|uniref:B-cell linker protein isoform X2 n=1 Tax=Frankliniella occidentalis TaxID=133901 RepID=A0A6J1T1L0_FRAOC|nr:B-cell linker protein isoform X2 [Frankliniella occidentalis]
MQCVSQLPQPSLVRRQIEQLQQSAASGRLPPHLSGTPLRPRLTRARTNLDVVWRSLDRGERSENRDPRREPSGSEAKRPSEAAGAAQARQEGRSLGGVTALVSRSVTHLNLCAPPVTPVQLPRQPLRVLQASNNVSAVPVAVTSPALDAVYQTIDEKTTADTGAVTHYDKPVSPPVPVDPAKRKRKAELGAQLGLTGSPGVTATMKPVPDGGHRTLPRKLTNMSVVEINIDIATEPSGRNSHPCHGAALSPTADSTSTLPLKKSARGSQLWRRFSSFNPCSRWDDWNNAKKCDGKRSSTTAKSQVSDPRPPVPNRPLPPTPRPHPETNSSPETSKGGLCISNLEHQPWFQNVDRKQAEELIKNGIDGYFLIRPSSQSQNPLTLTLWFNNRVYNISVRQRKDGRIALGFEKPDEQSFSSIEEMVINYQSENLLLFSRNERTGRTVLTKSPPREI